MRSILCVFIIAISFPVVSYAQWTKVVDVLHPDIDKFSQDNLGNIYVSHLGGDVNKYSKFGDALVAYSPTRNGKVDHIDATSQLKVLLFYENFQEYIFLDRYLSSPVIYSLKDFGLGFVSDVVPNFQQNVWVVDMSDFSLKLLSSKRNEILETKSLAKILDQETADIVSLSAHQNRMYLTDDNRGVFLFDNMGNFISKLPIVENDYFNFYQDQIYFIEQNELILKNLYNEENERIELPQSDVKRVLYSKERLVIFNKTGFTIYRYLRNN